jgi:enoyl-CoA hydratase/carnithine racemase
MALAGTLYGAEEALAQGLVDAVVPEGEGLARGRALAADVVRRGPVAVQVVKALVNAAEGEEREAALEWIAGALVAGTEDIKEGVAGFREKRAPRFEDR